MASIRKHRNKWQTQVRRDGHAPLSRSFLNRKDAETWARQTEVDLDQRQIRGPQDSLKRITVGDLLGRYLAEVTPRKRGRAVEGVRITKLIRSNLGSLSLSEVSPAHLAAFRDDRLKLVATSTVRREFVIIRHVFEVAIREWGVQLQRNPVEQISLPAPPPGRDRRLKQGDLQQLTQALAETRNALIGPLMHFAIATGLRRGELLSMRWQDVDLEQRLLLIPQTKTGVPRVVPITRTALDVLQGLSKATERVFEVSPNALRISWRRLTRRANIANLNFHDLRHEAISRFFELGLSVPEVALISGHRDPRMLFRYTHLRPSSVGKRLDELMEVHCGGDKF